MALTSDGDNCEAWFGLELGTMPAVLAPIIRRRTPPAMPSRAPGPIDCTSWFKRPARCCGLD